MSLPVYNSQLLVQRDDVPALVINPNNPPPWLQNSTAQIVYVQNYVQPYMPVDQNVYLQQYVQNPMYVNVDPRYIVESNQIYQNPSITQDKTNFMQIRPMRPTRSVRPRAYRQIQPRVRYPNNIQRVQNMQMNEMNGLSNVRSMNVMNAVNSANVRRIHDASMSGESLNPNINISMTNAINGAMTSDNSNLNSNRVTMGNVAINGAMASDNLNLINNRVSMGNVVINGAMTNDNLNLNNNRVSMGNVAINRAMTSDNLNLNMHRGDMANVAIHGANSTNVNINGASNFNNPNNAINGVINNSLNANENTIMTNVVGTMNATPINGQINASNRVSHVPNMSHMSINTFKAMSNAASNCDIGPNTLHRMTDTGVVMSNVTPNSNLYLPSDGVNCINTPVVANTSSTITNVARNDAPNSTAYNATVKNVRSLISVNANGAINIAKTVPIRNVAVNNAVATVAKIPNSIKSVGPNSIKSIDPNSIKSIGPNSVKLINVPNIGPNSVNTINGPSLATNSVNATNGPAPKGSARVPVAANVNIVVPTKSTPTKVKLERNNPNIGHNKILNANLDNPNDVEDKPAQTESKGNTRNEDRKRKSESPDELKSKLLVLDINEDKLQRKTVFTQARGRILNVETKENIPIDEDIDKINKAFNKDINDKDYVLTHVLDGFVIQESNVAFPIHKPTVEKTIRLSSDALKDLEDEIPSVAIVKETNIQTDEEKSNEKELLNEKQAKIKKTECLISDGNPFSHLTPAAIKNWTIKQLTNHLSSSGWKGTSSSFYEHEIDGESLLLVSKSQLLTIGVKEEQADVIIAFVNSGKS